MQFSCTTHHSPNVLLNETVPVKKNPSNRFKDMEMTAGGSYSIWNFVEWIRKGVEFAKVIKKKRHSLGFPFLVLVFSRGVRHFYGIALAMNLHFSRIFKTNLETSVKYLQRNFLNHPACFFFLEQTTDRQINLLLWVVRYLAHCTGLKRLPKPPQNKICYRLYSKYTSFSWFPIICSSTIWKSFFI